MPLYQYRDRRTGEVVEMIRSVRSRDWVPRHLCRITVQRIAVPRGLTPEHGADRAVPRALRQIEQGSMGHREISKYMGFSTETIKRAWNICLFIFAASFVMAKMNTLAGDITRGVSFSDGQRVGATDLHNLVDMARINTSFYYSQTLASAPLASDQLLVYSPTLTAFRRFTVASTFSLVDLITSQQAGTVVSLPDSFVYYSVADAKLEQITFQDGLFNNTNWIGGRSQLFVPNTNHYFMAWDGSAYTKLAYTNLFTNFLSAAFFTNAPASLHPTNADELWIWDSASGSNRQTTLAGLLTNSSPTTVLTNTDTFMLMSGATNGPAGSNGAPVVANITWSNMLATISNSLGQLRLTGQIPMVLPSGWGVVTNPWGVMPTSVRWVLLCTNGTGDVGYLSNDEVEVWSAYIGSGVSVVTPVATTTGLVVSVDSTNNVQLQVKGPHADTAASQTITPLRWNLKVYAQRLLP